MDALLWFLMYLLKIKKYCRAGVPSSLRSRAWMKLSGAQLLKEQHPKNFYNVSNTFVYMYI